MPIDQEMHDALADAFCDDDYNLPEGKKTQHQFVAVSQPEVRSEGADQESLTERLRNPMWAHGNIPFESPQLEQEENLAAMNEAADEIEALRHDVDRYMKIAAEHINDSAQARLDASLFNSMQEELTEGHLALDRLGAPREFDDGAGLIRELDIAERISEIPSSVTSAEGKSHG